MRTDTGRREKPLDRYPHSGPGAATAPANVLLAGCPSRQALDLIADKWTMLVIKALADGVRRYGDVHRAVEGISQKVLTQTPRSLERDGLVEPRPSA